MAKKGKAQETAGSLFKGNGQCCSCHFRPLFHALGERTKPRRMHENSTCTQQQRNNTRLKTTRPKKGPGNHHIGLSVRPTSPASLRDSSLPQGFSQPIPLEFLDSFRFPSLPFVAASLHRSALSILFRGPLRSARALESPNLSRLVSSAAILCSGACIHAGGSSSLQHSSQLSQNRSHQRPQSLPKSKPPPPKWARDTFFHHSGSSPLLSTCRHVEVSAVDVFVVLIFFFFLSPPSSSHAKPLLLVVVLLQCAEIAAYVLFPHLVVSGTSAWPLGTSRRTNPWSTCSEARVRSLRLQPQNCFCGAEMS